MRKLMFTLAGFVVVVLLLLLTPIWDRDVTPAVSVTAVGKPDQSNNFHFTIILSNHTRHVYESLYVTRGIGSETRRLRLSPFSNYVIESPPLPRWDDREDMLFMYYEREEPLASRWVNWTLGSLRLALRWRPDRNGGHIYQDLVP